MKFLKHGPEVLVGTPGRVIDLLERRIINFDNIRFVVLDEVDRMLDIGFRDDIRRILSQVKGQRRNAGMQDAPRGRTRTATTDRGERRGRLETSHAGPPQPRHQTMFVSATISDEIERLGRRTCASRSRS